MRNNFKITILTLILSLVFLNIVFVFLNSTQELKIIGFKLEGENSSANLVDQRIEIDFNSPIIASDISKYINIEPIEQYRTSIVGTKLILDISNNLKSDQIYKISISKDIQDRYGRKLEKDKIFEFQTSKLSLTYLQNNSNGEDKIVQSDFDFSNAKEIYSHDKIKSYSINKNILAVVVEETDKTNKIKIVDLKTKNVRDLSKEDQVISSISVSPISNQIAFSAYYVSKIDGFVIPKSLGTLSIYNYEKNESRQVDFNELSIDCDDVEFSVDGNSITFRDSYKMEYFTLSARDLSQFTSLGNFIGYGGYSKNKDKLIFTSVQTEGEFLRKPIIQILNSDKSTINITQNEIYSAEGRFFNRENKIVFGQEFDIAVERQMFELKELDLDTNEQRSLLKIDDLSLELANISPDDRFVVVEGYNREQLNDYTNQTIRGFMSKPEIAILIVYDFEKNIVVNKNINGIEANWQTF